MKTRFGFNQLCYSGLSILLLLLLVVSHASAGTPSGKGKPNRSGPAHKDSVERPREKVAQTFAAISPGIRGVLSMKAKGELIKMEVDLKQSTILDKKLLPLRISLEPAETSEAAYQALPRRFHVLPDTEAYTIAARDSSGKPVEVKEIRDTFSLAMGYPKYIKPELAKNLRVSVLSDNRWLPLPSRYDASRRMVVTESARQFGTYQLIAKADVVDQEIIAYPNPVQFGEFGGIRRTLKFLNVPLGAVIEIYTVTGDKIREIEAKVSPVAWDGEKGDGELVTSGLYIYRVQMPSEEAFGKIAVLR